MGYLMTNNNKIVKNAIKIRKRLNKKKCLFGRLFPRLMFIIVTLVLLSLFTVVCSADDDLTLTEQEVKQMYFSANQLTQTDPLYYIMTDSLYQFYAMPCVAQFTINNYDLESLNYISYDVPPTVNGITVVYITVTGEFVQLPRGYWTISHTTSGGSKFIYLDWEDVNGTRQMRIRKKYTNGAFVNCEIEIAGRSGTLDYNYAVIGTTIDKDNTIPLEYMTQNGLINIDASFVNLVQAKALMDKSYDYGFYLGRMDGIDEGYQNGLNVGQSSTVGKNLIGDAFRAPFEALKSFTLVEWTTESGQEISISIMSVFYTIIGISLFIWFLKLFSGG